MSSTTLAMIGHLIMGLAIIAAATVLLALHDVTETTAMALYAAAIGLIGGSLNTALALKVPAAAMTATPQDVQAKIDPAA